MGDAEQSNLGERELRWFHQHKGELEAKYPGQWVALGPEGLVAVGYDYHKVLDEASRLGFPNAIPMGIREKKYQGMKLIRARVRVVRGSES